MNELTTKSTIAFSPGMRVNWRTTVSGWQFAIIVNAVVLRTTKKRVQILLQNKNGQFETRQVTPEHLIYPRLREMLISTPLDRKADELIAAQSALTLHGA